MKTLDQDIIHVYEVKRETVGKTEAILNIGQSETLKFYQGKNSFEIFFRPNKITRFTLPNVSYSPVLSYINRLLSDTAGMIVQTKTTSD
jgi:hypothetical protein